MFSCVEEAHQHCKGGVEKWAKPFDGSTGTARLGEIDVSFLLAYSMGMYFAGHVGDNLDLRIFLTVGMIGSGTFVAMFGMGYWFNIHNFLKLFMYSSGARVVLGHMSGLYCSHC